MFDDIGPHIKGYCIILGLLSPPCFSWFGGRGYGCPKFLASTVSPKLRLHVEEVSYSLNCSIPLKKHDNGPYVIP